MQHPFTDAELTELFEIAKIALAIDPVREGCANLMDLSDEYLDQLRGKLNQFMPPVDTGKPTCDCGQPATSTNDQGKKFCERHANELADALDAQYPYLIENADVEEVEK